MLRITATLTLLISTVLTGCSTQTPFQMSHEGNTVQETYVEHVTGDQIEKSAKLSNPNLSFRQPEIDINKSPVKEYVDRRAPNPELFMYVYPHRATNTGVVVPAYEVSFPMFKQVHYMLAEDFYL